MTNEERSEAERKIAIWKQQLDSPNTKNERFKQKIMIKLQCLENQLFDIVPDASDSIVPWDE